MQTLAELREGGPRVGNESDAFKRWSLEPGNTRITLAKFDDICAPKGAQNHHCGEAKATRRWTCRIRRRTC